MHSFDSCCLGMSETLQKLRALLGPLLRVLFCGCTLEVASCEFRSGSPTKLMPNLRGSGVFRLSSKMGRAVSASHDVGTFGHVA